MSFAVVKFIEKQEVAVVPVSWIRGNKCSWPPKKLLSTIEPCIQKGITASDAWDLFSIQTLGLYETYNEARSKLPIAEIRSDLNSTDPEDCGRGKRLKKRRRMSSSSTESEDAVFTKINQKLKSPPKFISYINEPENYSCSFTLSTEKDLEQWNKNPEPALHAAAANASSSNVLASQSLIESSPRHVALNNLPSNILAFHNTILREIQIIKTNQKVIMETLDKMSNSAPANAASCRLSDDLSLIEDMLKLLPVTTEEHFNFINNKLNEENSSNQMIFYLMRIGGVSVDQGVKFMLRRLLSDDMAVKFSLMGLRGKKPFNVTNFFKVITGAVRSHSLWKNTPEKDIENLIGNWLRHSKGRIVQRNLYSLSKK